MKRVVHVHLHGVRDSNEKHDPKNGQFTSGGGGGSGGGAGKKKLSPEAEEHYKRGGVGGTKPGSKEERAEFERQMLSGENKAGHPHAVKHEGTMYFPTGKVGTHTKSGESVAEYENEKSGRVWASKGGKNVYPD